MRSFAKFGAGACFSASLFVPGPYKAPRTKKWVITAAYAGSCTRNNLYLVCRQANLAMCTPFAPHRPKPPDSIQHGHVVMLTEFAHTRELRVALAAARGDLGQAGPFHPAARPDIQFFAFFSAN